MSCEVNSQSGFLILDKPLSISSHRALSLFKKKFPKSKIGHTGTLDPLATGVLVVAIGEATKLINYLPEKSKSYEAELLLGQATDTEDSEGSVVAEAKVPELQVEQVQAALQSFLGKSRQRPPVYSAIKVKGKALYRYARAGQPLEVPDRPIEIFAIKLLHWQSPRLRFEVSCSRGTYVRSLVRDLGKSLGTLAHMTALRRLQSGPFALEQAWTLEKFNQSDPANYPWISLESVLDWPQFSLDSAQDYERLQNGVSPRALQPSLEGLQEGQDFVLMYQGRLVALASFAQPLFKLKRVLRRK